MNNILKRIPPFSSIWIKKCVRKHYSKILKPNCHIVEIETFVATRTAEGWKVYIKAIHPKIGSYMSNTWTNGYIFVLDSGQIAGEINSQEDCCFNNDILTEANNIIKEGKNE